MTLPEASGHLLAAVTLMPINTVNDAVKHQVRVLRNEDDIRRWMATDKLITPSEHESWLTGLKTSDKKQILVIIDNNTEKALGVVSIHAIDIQQKTTSWSLYLTQKARGGLGAAIEFAFINAVFDRLGMQKLNCEVIEGNKRVLGQHKKFLFQDEGFRRANIIKSGKRMGVHLLGLTKQEWLDGRPQIYKRYRRLLDRYSVTLRLNDESDPSK